MNQTAYLAPEGLEEALKDELQNITAQYGRLFLAKGAVQKVHWVQNIWIDPELISFDSISNAAKKLRSLQKLWVFYPIQNIRRAKLIIEQLPHFSPKSVLFPSIVPSAPLGAWTLIDSHTLLASPRTTSLFANGEVHFIETKKPPSRAYLKLWELFHRIGCLPRLNEKCLELGASPGSWTWVLHQLGANVIAVDRAPLASSIACRPNIAFHRKDAFSIAPNDFTGIDWVLSDVVCYPQKLLDFIKQWINAGMKVNWVCTIKFQGKIDLQIVKEFEKIENSQIVHLFHNKHELTWFLINRH